MTGAGQIGPRPRVGVVGAGAREHALALVLARTADVVITPGNPAMERTAERAGVRSGMVTCSSAAPTDIDADLWVIGPEAPLVDGLADRLRADGRLVFGPGADGARLEGSKAWMKEVLADAGVPTAAHAAFAEADPAIEYLRSLPAPWVVKTDGLAAGKGVLVTTDRQEAEADVREKLAGRSFGAAGRRVVIEEGLAGEELSVMAICDGTRAVALAPAQDFKRAGDGGIGPNTGGMGSYSPVPGVDAEVVEHVMDVAVRPTLSALRDRGIDYRGVLYAGLMMTPSGPKIIEFNVRFGDPETQVVTGRWQGDVAALLSAAAAGRLDTVAPPEFSEQAAVAVVLAAAGYPTDPCYGDRIRGVEAAAQVPGVVVHPAGVSVDEDGHLVTSGGRVLNVRALGATIGAARDRAYEAAAEISWDGRWYRNDIAATAARPVAEERR